MEPNHKLNFGFNYMNFIWNRLTTRTVDIQYKKLVETMEVKQTEQQKGQKEFLLVVKLLGKQTDYYSNVLIPDFKLSICVLKPKMVQLSNAICKLDHMLF